MDGVVKSTFAAAGKEDERSVTLDARKGRSDVTLKLWKGPQNHSRAYVTPRPKEEAESLRACFNKGLCQMALTRLTKHSATLRVVGVRVSQPRRNRRTSQALPLGLISAGLSLGLGLRLSRQSDHVCLF